MRFDEFKYRVAKVPFSEKWNLQYKRNEKAEQEVYNLYVKGDYDLVGTEHSRGHVDIQFLSQHQVIHTNSKHSIFYWRKIIENAKCIALVDSAMANFVEQLNIQTKKILIQKPGMPTATYKTGWTIK